MLIINSDLAVIGGVVPGDFHSTSLDDLGELR
jgi:hypothetical protein